MRRIWKLKSKYREWGRHNLHTNVSEANYMTRSFPYWPRNDSSQIIYEFRWSKGRIRWKIKQEKEWFFSVVLGTEQDHWRQITQNTVTGKRYFTVNSFIVLFCPAYFSKYFKCNCKTRLIKLFLYSNIWTISNTF